MDLSNVELLLEKLIREIRELKIEVKNINDELDWWSKDKQTFAKQILTALDRIEK